MLTKDQVKKIKWYRQSGAGVAICIGMPFLGITKMKKVCGLIFPNDMGFSLNDDKGSHFYHYFDYFLTFEEVKKLFKKVDTNFELFEEMKKRFYESEKPLENLGKKMISALDLFENFSQYFDPFYDKAMEYWRNSLFIDLLDPFGEEVLKFIFGKNLNKLSKQDLNLLTAPPELSNFQKEQRDLLDLYHLAQDKGLNNINAELRRHSEKYYWLKNDYAQIQYLDVAFFKKELQKMAKSKRIIEEIKKDLDRFDKTRKEQKKLISRLGFDKEVIKKLDFFNWIISFRDDRKKLTQITNYFLIELTKILAKKFGVEEKYLQEILPHELTDFVKNFNQEKIGILKERFAAGILTFAGIKKMEMISGLEVNEYFKVIESTIKASEIQGTTASSGKAIGTVKIVLNQNDFSKMKQDDILVASMTRPEYAPIMKKAGAIVTDEGGLTCHAAIVSRELGIPCIVGTQVATRSLNDGDLIDVDANHGLIKMIKKAKE